MKNNIIKYILFSIMSFLFTFKSLAQPNIAVSDPDISPAPAVYPNGGTETFQFTVYNDGTATSSPSVKVDITLTNLDFTNSTFNFNTDIVRTAGNTPFTWSYNATTKVLTATLNGSFDYLIFNTFQIKNLNVLGVSAMNNPTTGGSVRVNAPTNQNAVSSDDAVSSKTYTTAVLSVGLLSFEATKMNNCGAKLTWTSTEETNFDYYQLELSTDSKTFTALGNFQKSKGQNTRYEQLSDLKAKGNTVYYRLKMVDLDQSIHYSKIVSVQNDCTKKGNISITPNPANDIITIKEMNSEATLYIYDMTGRLCLTTALNELGNQEVNIGKLIQGTYMIHVRSEQETYYNKLVKQ